MAKGVMHKFKLNEISAVDRPAQGGAVMAIIKRDGGAGLYLAKAAGESALPEHVEAYLKREFSQDQRDKDAETGAALPDGSFPIKNRSDLRNAVRAYGRAKNRTKAKAHIVSRARTLGATSVLPEAWKSANFPLLADLSNDQVMEGLEKAVDAFKTEQDAVKFVGDAADAVRREYANALAEEIGHSVFSLRAVAEEIADDPAIMAKAEALQESVSQFIGHIQGITPDGIENGLVKAAVAEAGYTINGAGTLQKRETDMGFDIRKALGLPATATDADIEKAFGGVTKAAKFAGDIAKMSAEHSAYMSNDKAKMPEGGKEAFAAMSADERDAHIKANPCAKAAKKNGGNDGMDEEDDGDEDDAEKCIKVDGRPIFKRQVGDAVFAVMKSQQAAIEKAADREATAEFTKRAETAMSFIGKSDELGTMLRSIAKLAGGEKIAEAVAKKFEQLNELIKKGGSEAFKEIGKSHSPEGGSFAKAKDQIETIAKQLVADGKAKNIYKARDMARQQNPTLAKQEQDETAEEKKQKAA